MKFFKHLTPEAVQSLQKVHFFTQMYWLEDQDELPQLFAMPEFRPTELTITIRYSDWWDWEHDEPLRMNDGWLRDFEGNPELRVFRIEYETLAHKKEEMMRIIQRNKEWSLKVKAIFEDCSNSFELLSGEKGEDCDTSAEEEDEDVGYLCAKNTDLKEWKWTGTSKVGGRSWYHHKGDTVDYIVVIDTWRYVRGKA